MSSRRSSTWRRSGRIRSTPGSSWPGNNTPQSMISSRPRCSKTVMLRPISPIPPSAVTRSPPGASGPGGARSVIIAARRRPACRRPAPRSASGVAGTWGSRGSPVVDALQPQSGLRHGHATQPVLRVVERAERDVDLARGRDVAGCEGRQHVSQLAGREVAPHADEARRRPSPATAGSARRRRSSRPVRSRP